MKYLISFLYNLVNYFRFIFNLYSLYFLEKFILIRYTFRCIAEMHIPWGVLSVVFWGWLCIFGYDYVSVSQNAGPRGCGHRPERLCAKNEKRNLQTHTLFATKKPPHRQPHISANVVVMFFLKL